MPETPQPCEPFHHAYVGSATPGVWVCLRCPATLASVEISTTPVPAVEAAAKDWDC